MLLNIIIDILGWIITIFFFIAPIVFPNPWHFAKIYYIVLAIMSLVLELIRISLSNIFKNQSWFQRPTNSQCGKTISIPGISLNWAYDGGMPSGHEACAAFAFTLLFLAYPNIWSVILLLFASIIIFLFRYISLCHKPIQLIIGWIIGFIVAIITNEFI